MIIKSAQRAFILLTQRNVSKFYSGVRKYLPKERLKDFENAWGLNNLIKGPRIRKKFGKKWGVKIPTHIDIAPTTRCNLKCRGCYSSSHESEEDMTVENFEKIIIEAKELGIFQIAILGGEPFLRKDILPVLEKHKDIAFRLSTNGTLIDADILDFLKKSGHVFVFLSLEGFEEETDFWRGDGIYRKVQKSMRLLKQKKIPFGFSAVIHKKNKDVLMSEEFLDHMERMGNRLGLFFPYGSSGETQYFDLVMEEKETIKSLEKLESIERKYSMLFKTEGYISTQKPPKYFLNQGCTTGRNINITPVGFVEPCNGIQFHTANIFEKSLMEIVTSPFYREIYSCTFKIERRCVIIHEAEQIHEIIQNHNAVGSTPTSLPNLHRFLDVRDQTPT